MKRGVAAFFAAVLLATGCHGASSGILSATSSASPPSALTSSPVPCSQISTLRSLHSDLKYVTNPRTGDEIEYVVIGDAAVSNEVLVMFPGTGQILPSWPVQMLTNSTYSPEIVNDDGYKASEDGSVSLCHDYYIALFDYPGVGESPLNGSVTSDMIANDVDAMLTDASAKFGISTRVVDPIGWSLGTMEAMKYTFLSPAANPARTIHNLVLIATYGGGNESGESGGDPATCQGQLFGYSLGTNATLAQHAKTDLSELIFPYEGQTQAESGTNSGCTATASGGTITLSVTLQCTALNNCIPFLADSLLNDVTSPWSKTVGVDDGVFAQQREIAHDSSLGYCTTAGSAFDSEGCTASATPEQSLVDGGLCQTNDSDRDLPVSSGCDPLSMTGEITVINGYEDLFIQWTYGQALVNAYNTEYGAGTANLVTYPGLAGHGVMIQHPGWTQAQISAAL